MIVNGSEMKITMFDFLLNLIVAYTLITTVRGLATFVVRLEEIYLEHLFEWYRAERITTMSIKLMIEDIDVKYVFPGIDYVGAKGMKELILSKIERRFERIENAAAFTRRYSYELSRLQKIRWIIGRLFDRS
jgi:hypothetical protein